MKNDIYKMDEYRVYGENKPSISRKSNELKYIYLLRCCQSSKNKISQLYYRFRLSKMSKRTMIQIPRQTKIGAGFYIGHAGHIIINPRAILGKNINIASGVTIGQENRGSRYGSPVIGDNVWIGTNAVIVGKITIGDDVLIAPLSYVNFDVPSHSVVVGNPAKIISRENATEGYINKTI